MKAKKGMKQIHKLGGNYMLKRKIKVFAVIAAFTSTIISMTGCESSNTKNGVTEITMLQYKPEAVEAFEKIEEEFNFHIKNYSNISRYDFYSIYTLAVLIMHVKGNSA